MNFEVVRRYNAGYKKVADPNKQTQSSIPQSFHNLAA
jgi:hypothetical protein